MEGLAEEEGEVLDEGLIEALIEADGDGDSLADGLSERLAEDETEADVLGDSLPLGLTLADHEREKLVLPDGEVLADGD